ncbi:Perilipin-3 [Saguinus oedipus]|uniref:Perilipin-3 n=1 Tax=Saguinus oedipus TaxID=9490 RepID=A0ABQ9TRS5_SAGOE|nr:Perilipin-3 [Saguinus oedipus]
MAVSYCGVSSSCSVGLDFLLEGGARQAVSVPLSTVSAAETMSANGAEADASTQVTAEEPVQQPSVVDRVANMPLISSTCDMVSAAYASTKDSHPHVKTVCDAAEKGVRTLTAAAVSGAQPILSKLEPQSA